MTRETKIGLLVGLAFIIVIGILIADYSADAMKRPQAPVEGTVQNVLQSATNPGARTQLAEKPKGVTEPNRVIGDQRRATADNIRVGPPSDDTARIRRDTSADTHGNTGGPVRIQDDPSKGVTPPPGNNGNNRVGEDTAKPQPAMKEVLAGQNDTVFKWARQYMGGGTRENVEAIFKANPELKNDPRRVRPGTKYKIPLPPTTPATATRTEPATPTPSTPLTPRDARADKPETAAKVVTYVTKPGDNLWRIAVTQCGDARVVGQILELNKDLLHGRDAIHPNMPLKVPAKGS